MVMLIGVQSNQTPRALDIARPLRGGGIQVAIGGFHMSGVISMIDGDDPSLREAQAMGLSVFAGEAEGRLDEVLRDAYAGQLKPLYNFMNDLPGLDGAPIPLLSRDRVKRTGGSITSFDAGRGCPYQCSFCTIINVQGRKSRRRTPDDIEKIIRANLAQGLFRFFITDDNFARNKDWEVILDRLIHLREVEKLDFSFIIQVDTLCHKLPNFIDKCARPASRRSISGSRTSTRPTSWRPRRSRTRSPNTARCCWPGRRRASWSMPATSPAFPDDTAESILHDLEVIKRELPIDVLEIHYLTPLPGSEDHQKLFRAGIWMDPDLNKYDLHHITADHPRMSKEEWEYAYREAWRRYYSFEHCETDVQRRRRRCERSATSLFAMTWFKGCIELENVPSGRGRRCCGSSAPRSPADHADRAGLAVLSEISRRDRREDGALGVALSAAAAIYLRIKHDPKRYEYTDLADHAGDRRRDRNARDVPHRGGARIRQERQRIEKAIQRGNAPAEAAFANSPPPN